MPYLITGLMEILLETRHWRLLYALLAPWSYGNITRDKTMASCILLKGSWSYGDMTRDKTMASFVHLKVPGFMDILLERRP